MAAFGYYMAAAAVIDRMKDRLNASPRRLVSAVPQVEAIDVYLTDGKRLFRVIETDDGWVRVEDCRVPEIEFWMKSGELLGRWWLVEP